jgi:putative ABC transport system ATP-binding protein
MIQATNLSYTYQSGHSIQFPDIKIQQHGLILGPSGIGKTTLLHLFAGLISPTTGELIINDIAINRLTNRELDKFRKDNIGLILQEPHAIKAISLWDNLKLLQNIGNGQLDKKMIDQLIQHLSLEDVKHKLPGQLSLGQKQRLSIAMALVNNPSIILADEPTSSLDDKHCDQVVNLLLNQANQASAQLIVITHDQRVKRHFNYKIEL